VNAAALTNERASPVIERANIARANQTFAQAARPLSQAHYGRSQATLPENEFRASPVASLRAVPP
jgi:hypothetical protein